MSDEPVTVKAHVETKTERRLIAPIYIKKVDGRRVTLEMNGREYRVEEGDQFTVTVELPK